MAFTMNSRSKSIIRYSSKKQCYTSTNNISTSAINHESGMCIQNYESILNFPHYEDDEIPEEGVWNTVLPGTNNRSKLLTDKGYVKPEDYLEFGIRQSSYKHECAKVEDAYLNPMKLTKTNSIPKRHKGKYLTSPLMKKDTIVHQIRKITKDADNKKYVTFWAFNKWSYYKF